LLGGEGTRVVVPEAVEDLLMKHAVRAVIAVVLGAGLAAAAQAQSTSQQPSTPPATQMQSTAPSSTMQSTPPATTMKSTAAQKPRHAKAQKPQRMMRTAHLGKKQPIHTAHMTRHAPKSQTSGVGSSMPNAKNTAGTTMTNPAPAGAGGTTSTAPSTTTTTTTQPSTSPAKK
jgi:hypothetical protein